MTHSRPYSQEQLTVVLSELSVVRSGEKLSVSLSSVARSRDVCVLDNAMNAY